MSELRKQMETRVLVLDGAMGTALQDRNLSAEDFGGADLEGCNENLILTRPHLVEEIHRQYLESGADIVETNTFGSTPLVLDEYGLGKKALEISRLGAQIARKAADALSTSERPRFVAGSMGPTTKAISVTGGITFESLVENYSVQAQGLIEGGSDYLLLETSQDTRNVKAGLIGIDHAIEKTGRSIPIAVSGTIEPMGTMLGGQSIEAFEASLAHRDLLYIGLNCATGPEFMTDHIRSVAQLSRFPIACVPNAGLPDEDGNYLETPSMIATILGRFLEKGWLNLVGGCCGTTPAHIRALAELAARFSPRVAEPPRRSFLSGVDYLEITDEMAPVVVGERTNVIGSRKFKRLINDGKLDDAAEIARQQIKKGAQIIDVCVANPDRDEDQDIREFLETIVQKVRVPYMIDSTDPKVIETALTYSQGKAIINSVNLEDGEERFEQVIPLAKKFGAALVVGCIDDDPKQGMGVHRQRKLEIARRSYDLLVNKYGVEPEDIYWDPLVFPCATGDEQYVGSAEETIEGVRLIKKEFPRTRTVLGISNVSFGLPPAGREVLNTIFLHHCVEAGLDLAIVNSETMERITNIPEKEIQLADDLIFNRISDPITPFANHFRDRKVAVKIDRSNLSLDERLASYIIEGSKDGLVSDLDLKLKEARPLEIINGPLMKGMDEVGRLFNANKMIVAEVLQSAESMKTAVAHLEQFMDKADSSQRGKVLLATVKGDVHDIGKNLVEIILSNNGFEVINLGIKVPPEQLIQAVREHNPDIVGLSGLLVKSAQQMIVTADDFTKAGVNTPMLVGGAALSENFVDKRIASAYDGTVAYASDAMNGLDLAKVIVEPGRFEEFKKNLEEKRAAKLKALPAASTSSSETDNDTERSSIPPISEPPQPSDFKRHLIRNTPVDQIWSFINPLMLYGRHLGIKGGVVKKLNQAFKEGNKTLLRELEETEAKALTVWRSVQEVMDEYRETDLFRASAVYQFFHAESEGNHTRILSINGTKKKLAEFEFPRQKRRTDGSIGLCLSDYVNPASGGVADNLALFAVTFGKGIRELSEQLKNRGDYLKSHILQALALESAEAYAELLHSQIRKTWGFPDAPEMTMMNRFQAKYQGKRYSFGYPACPRLDDQKTLFDLLQPEEIGIELTDGFMMDPEASVSAIVFHHPEATYFSVGQSLAGDDNRA